MQPLSPLRAWRIDARQREKEDAGDKHAICRSLRQSSPLPAFLSSLALALRKILGAIIIGVLGVTLIAVALASSRGTALSRVRLRSRRPFSR